jgi:hypothetical protein
LGIEHGERGVTGLIFFEKLSMIGACALHQRRALAQCRRPALAPAGIVPAALRRPTVMLFDFL